MANFSLLKISSVEHTDLDTAIKSSSDSGLVKTRLPFTKIRKLFTVEPVKYSTQEELDELLNLYEAVRTVTPFVFDHPTKKDQYNNPVQYTVRFRENIKYKQTANLFYEISTFALEEV